MMAGGFDNEERQYSREIWRLKNEIWIMAGSLNEVKMIMSIFFLISVLLLRLGIEHRRLHLYHLRL